MIRDTLLIIDDSELDLAILDEIFKNLFRVVCVPDARQGWNFLHQNEERVCAILLDICLEKQGAGFTVLHQIQANSLTADLPVILITTDANEKDVRASVERGAVDFLVKPVNPHTVQERVCSVVRSSWPQNSTILDRKSEPEAEEKRSVQEEMNVEGAQALSEAWICKLESFCRFRPGMDMEAHRKLGEITALLAERYVEQFPHSGLTQEDAVLIGSAAVFCDIGLLGLPDRMLEGKEQQEGKDAQLYYQHIWMGYELLTRENQENALFRYAAEIALWHHKNVDGSGHPLDADGSAIPLSAQLTRTGLRIQYYLHYYRGYEDGAERMLRALKNDVGVMIAPEMYEIAELERKALQTVMQQNWRPVRL